MGTHPVSSLKLSQPQNIKRRYLQLVLTGFLSIFLPYFAYLNRWFRWTLLLKKYPAAISVVLLNNFSHLTSCTESLPILSNLAESGYLLLYRISDNSIHSCRRATIFYRWALRFQNSFQLRERQLWNDEKWDRGSWKYSFSEQEISTL